MPLKKGDTIIYDPTQKSLFPETHYKLRELLHEWERKIGLEVTLSYDAITQGYLDTSRNIGGTAGDLTLNGKWLLFGNKYNKPFFLSFRMRDRHSFTDKTPADFRSEAGLLWGTVDGFNDSGAQIPSFYFSQVLLDEKLQLHYGQFSIDSFFDSHSMRSAKRFFLNQAFSTNPTVNFPSYGAGFIAQWQANDRWYFTVGGSNIQEIEEGKEVDLSLTSEALFESFQASYIFQGVGGKNGKLQIMGWNSDANGEELTAGNGLSITLEHGGANKGENYILKYATADGDSTFTETLFFLAYGKEIKTYNHLGIGAGVGKSADTSVWQTVFEMYYKIQLAKELILTPDFQVIIGDGIDNENNIRMVAGLRLGLTF